MPVFPLVGSIRVSPGLMRPFFWASSTMRFPIRSFTEPPAFRYSHLARYSQPVLRPMFFRRTIGVLPIDSRIEDWIWLTGDSCRADGEAPSVTCPQRRGNRPKRNRGGAEDAEFRGAEGSHPRGSSSSVLRVLRASAVTSLHL